MGFAEHFGQSSMARDRKTVKAVKISQSVQLQKVAYCHSILQVTLLDAFCIQPSFFVQA